jgi:hypothetical protein
MVVYSRRTGFGVGDCSPVRVNVIKNMVMIRKIAKKYWAYVYFRLLKFSISSWMLSSKSFISCLDILPLAIFSSNSLILKLKQVLLNTN